MNKSVTGWCSATMLIFLSACGGGGNGSGTTEGPSNASPGGIWNGTDSISGLEIIGVVDEAGDFHFIRSDGTQYVGTASVSGSTISANYQGITQFGYVFTDGSTYGSGTLSGTLIARSSLNANVQFKTSLGNSSSGTLSLTFNALYNSGSSLSAVSGNYTDPTSGATVSVSSNGAIFEQDAENGCVINGTVSIIDSSYDAYKVSYSYANCTGTMATLNGTTLSGLAVLDTTKSPVQAVIGVTGTVGSTDYAEVLTLNRQ